MKWRQLCQRHKTESDALRVGSSRSSSSVSSDGLQTGAKRQGTDKCDVHSEEGMGSPHERATNLKDLNTRRAANENNGVVTARALRSRGKALVAMEAGDEKADGDVDVARGRGS